VKIDLATRKISLSLKAMTTSPWDTIKERIYVGSRVQGKVTRTAEFGAFVELEPGIEGLIHISELGTNRVRRVRDVLQEGKEVEVQIVSIDWNKSGSAYRSRPSRRQRAKRKTMRPWRNRRLARTPKRRLPPTSAGEAAETNL